EAREQEATPRGVDQEQTAADAIVLLVRRGDARWAEPQARRDVDQKVGHRASDSRLRIAVVAQLGVQSEARREGNVEDPALDGVVLATVEAAQVDPDVPDLGNLSLFPLREPSWRRLVRFLLEVAGGIGEPWRRRRGGRPSPSGTAGRARPRRGRALLLSTRARRRGTAGAAARERERMRARSRSLGATRSPAPARLDSSPGGAR